MTHRSTPSFSLTRLAAAASLAAMLSACGGGGDEGTTTPTAPAGPPAITSGLVEIPLQLLPGENSHFLGSPEAQAFDLLNRARTECGFGALAQDTKLDRAADGQAKYQVADYLSFSHFQTNRANPFFTAVSPEDRATMTGYLNANQSNGRVSEGMAGGYSINGNFNLAYGVYNLLNAPYHALDMLAPRQHVGVSVQWAAKAGFPDRHAGTGVLESAMVMKYGTPVTNGRATVQTLPTNDVMTYPCSASTGKIMNTFRGEVPDPLAGRNHLTNPAGTPFYVVARHGSGLRVTSAKLTSVASGKVVPLMAPRHSDTEIYPGTTSRLSTAELMDWAFIFPDEALEVGKYRMEITAMINGKPVNKVVEFTTTNTLLN